MIRRAVKKDIPRIMELLVQVNMVHHNGRPDLFKGPVTKYTREELEQLLVDEKTPILVSADESDEVEGYAFCVIKEFRQDQLMQDIRTLYIDDLCVDEQLRGRHVGQRLYEAVLDFARESGCYNVTLNVWSCNPSAMKFYERCGLVPQKVGMEKIL